jgi:inosine-uridine nucleoside N-ribohydrolase
LYFAIAAAGSDHDMAAGKSRPVLNLVIDTDVGSDDAMAIILCCAAQMKGDVNIWGVTCVHGNTSLQNVCANTLKTLHTLGRLDVSIPKATSRTASCPTEPCFPRFMYKKWTVEYSGL